MEINIPDSSLPPEVAAERVRCIKVALSAEMPMDGGTLYRLAWRDAAYSIAMAILEGKTPTTPPEALDAFSVFRTKQAVS